MFEVFVCTGTAGS